MDSRRARLKIDDLEPVGFNELGDGYRGMPAPGVDLIRWITRAFPTATDPMACPVGVLIQVYNRLRKKGDAKVMHRLRKPAVAGQVIGDRWKGR